MLSLSKGVLCICVSFQESRDSIKKEPKTNVYDIFFYHIEEHFKVVYVLIKNSFRCAIIGRYRHTTPEALNFDSNILLY